MTGPFLAILEIHQLWKLRKTGKNFGINGPDPAILTLQEVTNCPLKVLAHWTMIPATCNAMLTTAL